MLLLVLILVLAAFALLIVALLMGSVVWAWLSVVVSVGAAGALLLDWMQRRAAVRDEEVPDTPSAEDRRVQAAASDDAEPITEQIPIIPPVGYPAAPAGYQAGDGSRSPQFDATSESEQTVMLPAARPPSSVERPSGAIPVSGLAEWDSSPTVTDVRGNLVAPSPDGAIEGQAPPAFDAAGPGDETQIPPPAAAAQSALFDSGLSASFRTGPNGSARPAAGTAALGALSAHTEMPDIPAADDPADPAARRGAVPDHSAVQGHAQGGSGVFGDSVGADPGKADAGGPDVGEVTAFVPASPDAEHQHPALPSERGAATALSPAGAQRSSALPPAGPDGEPPEEPWEPTAGGIVAGLPDEVVVVDERPRYHVVGCPSLAAKELIPLPASEAVELGFSPCGWCTPNWVLADRHRTAAR